MRPVPIFLLLAAACHQDMSAAQRSSCAFERGATAETTLTDQLPPRIPIDHFVVVMQENRSFDHYLGALTVPGQTVDGPPAGASNPNPQDGGVIARFHQGALCFPSPAEEWDDIHLAYDDGGMDRFTVRSALSDPMADPTGARAISYYDERDLPFYYALARSFAVSDRHFSAVLTNTFPNRMYFMCGTSFGLVNDMYPMRSTPNLFTRLNDASVDWKVYAQELPTPALLADTFSNNLSHFVGFDQFFTDAAAGTLAPFSIVEGSVNGGRRADEDPPTDFQVGQAMVQSVVNALMASPQWGSSALLFTYDEGGGFYDHVPPPKACAPDDIAPNVADGGFAAGFDQYGIRVPLIVVSPYAKRGYVSHHVTDHTSLLRLIEARFGLPALTKRDANAEPPFDMFDFSRADTSAVDLPDASVDPDGAAACATQYP
jgi:phospholipase C